MNEWIIWTILFTFIVYIIVLYYCLKFKRNHYPKYLYTRCDECGEVHNLKVIKIHCKGNKYLIIKCTIPQDSKFIYEGEYYAYYDKSYKAYASHKLLPLCVVK